jgi:D-alanine-D-alanine ligase
MREAKRKLRIALIFGGRSGEHDVSVVSARCVLDTVDRNRYEVTPVRISRGGAWEMLPDLSKLDSLEPLDTLPGVPVYLRPGCSGGTLTPLVGSKGSELKADVYFPLVHGRYGEDGTLQGLLEMAGAVYAGAGVAASALAMDKVLTKAAFRQAGLAVAESLVFRQSRWEADSESIIRGIEQQVGYPCFIKPANTGSSVGITKVHNREELPAAVSRAAEVDSKMLAEIALDAREIECGVLGNEEPEASVPGEVFPRHEFYDYEAKYAGQGSRVEIPAPLEEELTEQVRRAAVTAYQSIDCSGMARVDFFLDRKSHQLYINEINTIPGFTPQSMFPLLWKESGISYPALIGRLIELAMEKKRLSGR